MSIWSLAIGPEVGISLSPAGALAASCFGGLIVKKATTEPKDDAHRIVLGYGLPIFALAVAAAAWAIQAAIMAMMTTVVKWLL